MFLARREQEIIRDLASEEAEDWSNPEWITQRLKDRQLSGAIRAICDTFLIIYRTQGHFLAARYLAFGPCSQVYAASF